MVGELAARYEAVRAPIWRGVQTTKQGFPWGTDAPHLGTDGHAAGPWVTADTTAEEGDNLTGVNSNRSRPIWPSGKELCLQFNRGTCHYGARCQYEHVEHLWQQRSRGLSPSGHAAREFWISRCRPLLVDHPLCPVTAVLTNFRALGPAAPGPAPAFPMTGPAFNRKLKALTSRIGVSGVSSHSLRTGGATWALSSGIPGELVKAMGDWKRVLPCLLRSNPPSSDWPLSPTIRP